MSRTDPRLRFNLPIDLRRAAERVAARDGGTLAELVRAGLRRELTARGLWPPRVAEEVADARR